MTTEYLYEFLVLSKVRNFSQAARTLYISQPVLSRHVLALEKHFGTPLLERSTHSVVLTDAGRLLASQIPSLLNSCDKALHMLQLGSHAFQGHVRIACSLEISYAAHIKLFVGQFMEHHRDITLSFDVTPANMPQDLLSRYDILFTPCAYYDLPTHVLQHLIFSHACLAYMPAAHPLIVKPSLSLRSLAGETLVVPYADEMFGPYAQNYLLAEKLNRGSLKCLNVPNLATALFMVSIGRGILLGPRYLKHMLPLDMHASSISITDKQCCFHEYIYYVQRPENPAAGLFYSEFAEMYLHSSQA